MFVGLQRGPTLGLGKRAFGVCGGDASVGCQCKPVGSVPVGTVVADVVTIGLEGLLWRATTATV